MPYPKTRWLQKEKKLQRRKRDSNLLANPALGRGLFLVNFYDRLFPMKYILQSKNITISPGITTLIESKIKMLERFVSRFDPEAVEARIEVGKPSRHHHTGLVFYAEINLKIPGKLLRAEATHLDLVYAVNEVFKEMERQVKDYKDKIITKNKFVQN